MSAQDCSLSAPQVPDSVDLTSLPPPRGWWVWPEGQGAELGLGTQPNSGTTGFGAGHLPSVGLTSLPQRVGKNFPSPSRRGLWAMEEAKMQRGGVAGPSSTAREWRERTGQAHPQPDPSPPQVAGRQPPCSPETP